MGSQTLEILRQGVWASLTGGWFYDPHQDFFCNTFHLYIWLFLLCLPFTIYVYFPPKAYIWYIYCISVAIVIAFIKILNYTLHYLYDTSDCIREESEELNGAPKRLGNRPNAIEKSSEELKYYREDEGIELQVLSSKTNGNSSNKPRGSIASYSEAGGIHSTDAESMESIELIDVKVGLDKATDTVDLKAEVHRKNSSGSAEDEIFISLDTYTIEDCKNMKKDRKETRKKRQKPKTDNCANASSTTHKSSRSSSLKNRSKRDELEDLQDAAEGLLIQKTFTDEVLSTSRSNCNRRHSNFTNSAANIHPKYVQIKPTGSLELGYIDKNLNQMLTSDGLYFHSSHSGVRRIRSTALETSCPEPSLTIHPNSLEIIGCKSRNPLPPPSSSMVRNQYSSLCPYYGSEIVYPIAEQSDEHQTSQGADSDLDSVLHNSDSDYEECDRHRYPYLYVKLKKLDDVTPYKWKKYEKCKGERCGDDDITTTRGCENSKDMLLGPENAIVDVQIEDIKNDIECVLVEDEGDKILSESCSSSSLEMNEIKVCKVKKRRNTVKKDTVIKTEQKVDEQPSCSYNLPETENQPDDIWKKPTTISLEQDINKILQDSGESLKNLGAIPKKTRNQPRPMDSSGKRTPKSESSKCGKCRCLSKNKNEASCSRNHDDQHSRRESHGYYIVPASNCDFLETIEGDRPTRVYSRAESSSTSRINELSSLLPTTPLVSAVLASRRDLPIALCLSKDGDETPFAITRRRATRVKPTRSRHAERSRKPAGWIITMDVGPHKTSSLTPSTTPTSSRRLRHGSATRSRAKIKELSDVNGSARVETSTLAAASSLDHYEPSSTTKADMAPSDFDVVTTDEPTNAEPTEQEEGVANNANQDNNGYTFVLNPPIVMYDGDDDITGQSRTTRFKFIQDQSSGAPKIKNYYRLKLLPHVVIKVTLDRLKLLALLDRNLTFAETIASIFLCVLVALLGSLLLYLDFYRDIPAFVFCFVMASSQYSLLKSVQPDAASPMHGFNRIISYSRPIYFSMCCIVVLALHFLIVSDNLIGYTVTMAEWLKDMLSAFILFFPVWFSLGLFPQIDTFLMYSFEQIDMHGFGGNAMSSLLASVYCVIRSILVVAILVGPAYGGLSEKKSSQHLSYSIFCAGLVASSYHLSRCVSDPTNIWMIVKKHLWPPDIYRDHDVKNEANEEKLNNTSCEEEMSDPLPKKLQETVNGRLKNDILVCGLISVLVFGLHSSTIFTALQPELSPILWSVAAGLGLLLHYIIPQLRKHLPWTCIARPVLRQLEHQHFETQGPMVIMWFERVYVYLCFVERNVIYPLLFVTALTEDGPRLTSLLGPLMASFAVTVCGLKCLRGSYSHQNIQYMILIFTALVYKFDYKDYFDTFIVTYFFMSVVYHKVYELLLKVQFVVTYIAPWQITWGSAFHAFAQPFSVPHSAMLFLQAIVSAVLSTPLNPFLGSAIFLTSYVRPIKFWERNYNTRRVDHSNTPLSSHLDRNLGADDNNLNSIFYEHLTRSLQHSLCGDLLLGRWGLVSQGDCFVMASDYLNCLIHIIEVGNGLITFQMRGLEFRGTYCQQREVEAITEGVEENSGCCCCDAGHLPHMLSVNAAFSQRWLAWEVTAAKYVLEGYSISDNSALSMFQVFEFRRILVSYYVKSIIFYTIKSPKLEEWLNSDAIHRALQPMRERQFVDLDPVFNSNIDEDFDVQNSGMTKATFYYVHGDWIAFCAEKFGKNVETGVDSSLAVLCFALSLLGRRTLGAVSHNTVSSAEFFLYGLHALFKGDFRITCARDEWVFIDMDLLKTVVAPGVRMSLKLHQDHFMSPDEYDELPALFHAITKHQEKLVISHEGDPAWRNAVLSGTPSLLALRHVLDDGSDEYKIIMLNKRYLSFRVIKVNRECVRGLWAGQQQELVYLRNRNPERGSIQNAKQALRNIINSSCDQPIGYPIYVSPLTTSYADTNEQYCSIVGGAFTLQKIQNSLYNTFRRIRKRCVEGCSSGASTREEMGMGNEGVYAMTPVNTLTQHNASGNPDHGGSMERDGFNLRRTGDSRGSSASMGKPPPLPNLIVLLKEKEERPVVQVADAQQQTDEGLVKSDAREDTVQKVMIIDPNFVYDGVNLGRRIDVLWPTEYMRTRGGRSYWKNWVPEYGMEGYVVHKWTPGNKEPSRRSHVDRTILLVQIEDKFIPIAEQGVVDVQKKAET